MSDDERRRLSRLEKNLRRRALIFELVRAFFRERDFLEVETPVRTPAIAPEPHIIPFTSEDWFLATSPELYMKRMLAAGYERIFQLSRCFRKDERGRQHNPEFTMLEWYRAGADYNQMIRDTEQIVITLAAKLGFGTTIEYKGGRIDIRSPWPRLTVREAFLKAAGWDPIAEHDPLRFDPDLVARVIPYFSSTRPTVLTDYPAAMASLARLKPGEPDVAERAEVFIGALELANAYSELGDAREQENRFREASAQIEKEQGRQATMPNRFLEAVARLPECGGIALGMDRLVMLLCDADSIDDVIAFTADTA
jgi:lysyl-tRNA synthetase class 2